MSLGRWSRQQIYLYRHAVDMRRSIDGLATMIEQEIQLSPFEPTLFVFTNKKRDKIKCLAWGKVAFGYSTKNGLNKSSNGPNGLNKTHLF